MNNGPDLVATLGRWKLKRWQYDNAPLIAERECGTITIELDNDGALDAEFADDRGSLCVPADILAELLKDHEARKRALQSSQSEPAKGGPGGPGWLVPELNRALNEATPEERKRVAEHPSGYLLAGSDCAHSTVMIDRAQGIETCVDCGAEPVEPEPAEG